MESKKRSRKTCPKCESLSISTRSKSTKKYKCWSCKAVFETPRIKILSHGEIALRAV